MTLVLRVEPIGTQKRMEAYERPLTFYGAARFVDILTIVDMESKRAKQANAITDQKTFHYLGRSIIIWM